MTASKLNEFPGLFAGQKGPGCATQFINCSTCQCELQNQLVQFRPGDHTCETWTCSSEDVKMWICYLVAGWTTKQIRWLPGAINSAQGTTVNNICSLRWNVSSELHYRSVEMVEQLNLLGDEELRCTLMILNRHQEKTLWRRGQWMLNKNSSRSFSSVPLEEFACRKHREWQWIRALKAVTFERKIASWQMTSGTRWWCW